MGNPQSTIRHPSSAMVFVWCVVLSLGVPLWSWGASLQEKIEKEKQNVQQLKQEIHKTRKQRDRLRKKAETVSQEIDRLRKKAETVSQEIHRLDHQEHKERQDAASIKKKIRRIDRELNKTDTQLSKLRSEMNDKKAVIGTRLKRLYMEGRAGWISPLVAAGSYGQFERRLRYLSSLAAWERDLFEKYRKQVAQHEQLQAKRASDRESWRVQKDQIDNTLSKIQEARSQKRVILTSLGKTRQSEKQKLLMLHQREHRKEALLETLHKEMERRSHVASGTIKKQATDVFRRGALLWPADGDVVGSFGRQKHQTLDTYVRKKGIEIASKEGSVIRAVSSGHVVYADWLRGYGLVVIMDHGNNYFTFYAHASRLLVKEGETVAKGAVLGETGSSGLTSRSILYFELRKGTKPVDPLHWLAKR